VTVNLGEAEQESAILLSETGIRFKKIVGRFLSNMSNDNTNGDLAYFLINCLNDTNLPLGIAYERTIQEIDEDMEQYFTDRIETIVLW
jgi:hypothetical protein